MTRNWRLEDTFDKPSNNLWNDWDNLEPSEREEIETRYEKNKNHTGMSRLRKELD